MKLDVGFCGIQVLGNYLAPAPDKTESRANPRLLDSKDGNPSRDDWPKLCCLFRIFFGKAFSCRMYLARLRRKPCCSGACPIFPQEGALNIIRMLAPISHLCLQCQSPQPSEMRSTASAAPAALSLALRRVRDLAATLQKRVVVRGSRGTRSCCWAKKQPKIIEPPGAACACEQPANRPAQTESQEE